MVRLIPDDEPAPTIGSSGLSTGRDRWVEVDASDQLGLKGEDGPSRRPATTIAGDPRVFQPGGHHQVGQQSENAIRISVEEAAVLQGFRPDYPWQGSRSEQFQQVGNAVPPPLAHAVVGALLAP